MTKLPSFRDAFSDTSSLARRFPESWIPFWPEFQHSSSDENSEAENLTDWLLRPTGEQSDEDQDSDVFDAASIPLEPSKKKTQIKRHSPRPAKIPEESRKRKKSIETGHLKPVEADSVSRKKISSTSDREQKLDEIGTDSVREPDPIFEAISVSQLEIPADNDCETKIDGIGTDPVPKLVPASEVIARSYLKISSISDCEKKLGEIGADQIPKSGPAPEAIFRSQVKISPPRDCEKKLDEIGTNQVPKPGPASEIISISQMKMSPTRDLEKKLDKARTDLVPKHGPASGATSKSQVKIPPTTGCAKKSDEIGIDQVYKPGPASETISISQIKNHSENEREKKLDEIKMDPVPEPQHEPAVKRALPDTNGKRKVFKIEPLPGPSPLTQLASNTLHLNGFNPPQSGSSEKKARKTTSMNRRNASGKRAGGTVNKNQKSTFFEQATVNKNQKSTFFEQATGFVGQYDGSRLNIQRDYWNNYSLEDPERVQSQNANAIDRFIEEQIFYAYQNMVRIQFASLGTIEEKMEYAVQLSRSLQYRALQDQKENYCALVNLGKMMLSGDPRALFLGSMSPVLDKTVNESSANEFFNRATDFVGQRRCEPDVEDRIRKKYSPENVKQRLENGKASATITCPTNEETSESSVSNETVDEYNIDCFSEQDTSATPSTSTTHDETTESPQLNGTVNEFNMDGFFEQATDSEGQTEPAPDDFLEIIRIRFSENDPNKFSCPVCRMKLSSKGSLVRHVKGIHLHEKPFNCEFCEKAFSRKPTYLKHLETHR